MLGFVALSIVLFPVVGVDLIDLLLGQTMLLSQVLLHGAVHHAELLRVLALHGHHLLHDLIQHGLILLVLLVKEVLELPQIEVNLTCR